jgi:hypothetical protein
LVSIGRNVYLGCLRRILESNTRAWRNSHSKELSNFCPSPNNIGDKIKQDEMDRVCKEHRRDEKCVQNVGQETRREYILTWEDKMDVKEIGGDDANWIHLRIRTSGEVQ